MFVSTLFPAKVSRGTAKDCPGVLAFFKEGTQADAGEEGCDWGSQRISGVSSCQKGKCFIRTVRLLTLIECENDKVQTAKISFDFFPFP